MFYPSESCEQGEMQSDGWLLPENSYNQRQENLHINSQRDTLISGTEAKEENTKHFIFHVPCATQLPTVLQFQHLDSGFRLKVGQLGTQQCTEVPSFKALRERSAPGKVPMKMFVSKLSIFMSLKCSILSGSQPFSWLLLSNSDCKASTALRLSGKAPLNLLLEAEKMRNIWSILRASGRPPAS